MLSVSLTLESITISDMLMPDHAPGHPDHSVPDQPGKGVPFAFQFGYIIAVSSLPRLFCLGCVSTPTALRRSSRR